jgi:hypothetical protein
LTFIAAIDITGAHCPISHQGICPHQVNAGFGTLTDLRVNNPHLVIVQSLNIRFHPEHGLFEENSVKFHYRRNLTLLSGFGLDQSICINERLQ